MALESARQVNYCAANALLDQLAAFSSETARPEAVETCYRMDSSSLRAQG